MLLDWKNVVLWVMRIRPGVPNGRKRKKMGENEVGFNL